MAFLTFPDRWNDFAEWCAKRLEIPTDKNPVQALRYVSYYESPDHFLRLEREDMTTVSDLISLKSQEDMKFPLVVSARRCLIYGEPALHLRIVDEYQVGSRDELFVVRDFRRKYDL